MVRSYPGKSTSYCQTGYGTFKCDQQSKLWGEICDSTVKVCALVKTGRGFPFH